MFACVTDTRLATMPLLASCGGGGDSPEATQIAILLHARLSDEAAQFICRNLQLDWAKGGGGLIVRKQIPTYGAENRLCVVTDPLPPPGPCFRRLSSTCPAPPATCGSWPS